jgi:hypothetical protein
LKVIRYLPYCRKSRPALTCVCGYDSCARSATLLGRSWVSVSSNDVGPSRPPGSIQHLPMTYEFYFLKETGPKEPEILRVIAASYDHAAAMVARLYGCTAPIDQGGRVKEYIESIAIRPIEVQNLFESRFSSPRAR